VQAGFKHKKAGEECATSFFPGLYLYGGHLLKPTTFFAMEQGFNTRRGNDLCRFSFNQETETGF